MGTPAEDAMSNYGIITYKNLNNTVTVVWQTPFVFGDSFQYAQGAYAAADLLGVKRNKVTVTDIEAVGGTIQVLVFSRK